MPNGAMVDSSIGWEVEDHSVTFEMAKVVPTLLILLRALRRFLSLTRLEAICLGGNMRTTFVYVAYFWKRI